MDELRDYLALSHEQRLELLASLQVQKAELAACEQVLLHAIAVDAPEVRIDPGEGTYLGPLGGGDKDWVDEEVACVLRVSSRTAGDRLGTAERLVTLFPDTLAALAAGEVSLPHALRLSDGTFGLDDDITSKVEAAVLPRAARQTPGQFAASIRKAVARFDTRDQEARHEDARAERRVVFTPREDGMCDLWAHLPADAAAAVRDQVYRCAAQAKGRDGSDDQRSADQRRADTLVDLIVDPTGASGGASPTSASAKTTVNVTVALSTLLAMDGHGGELGGHGPIPAALARVLAFDPNATWRRMLTDEAGHFLDAGADTYSPGADTPRPDTARPDTARPDTARPDTARLDAGAHTYQPGAALDRHIRLRDQTCRFPGCRRNSETCELDHRLAWADGGLTTVENMQALCPRHHHLKHETRWQVHRQPDGSTRWISPTGRSYLQPPPDPLPVDTTMAALIYEPAPF
jgi:hypothetical protein